jgi:outer membrane protein OmpA-like peptidoglycan-associated protein
MQRIKQVTNVARRQILPQTCLLCALLLAAGTLAQAAEPGVTILNENLSWCTIFHALSLQVPPECRAQLTKTVVFTDPSTPAPGYQPYAFATTRIQFRFDSSALAPESQPILDTFANVLKDPRMADQVVRVEGHTDSVGSVGYNRRLSSKRAMAVQHYLHEHHGIALIRIPAIGKGPTEPYDPKHPTAALNRRVQFVNLSAKGGQS